MPFSILCWDINFYRNSLSCFLHGIFQVVLSCLFPVWFWVCFFLFVFSSSFLVSLRSAPSPVLAYLPFPSNLYAFMFPTLCGLWIICAVIFPSTPLSFQSFSIPFCLHPFFCFLVPSCLSNVSTFSPYVIPLRIFALTSPFPITRTSLSPCRSSRFCEVPGIHSSLSSASLPVFGKGKNSVVD